MPCRTCGKKAQSIRNDKKTLLDVGCGSGAAIKAAMQRWQVCPRNCVGVDLDTSYRRILGRYGIGFIVGDARTVNIVQHHYITAWHLLEHLERADALELVDKLTRQATCGVWLKLATADRDLIEAVASTVKTALGERSASVSGEFSPAGEWEMIVELGQ